ncbi:MAG: UbiA family prenyltransferase [Actinomycetota bacterium]|nr:UbiA family prenyltransferase [Actinomycetota bacterium]
METRKLRGRAVSLVMSSHPLPTAAMTVALAAAAALTGRSGAEVVLVALTIATGQLTIGWLNDVVDRRRDAKVGRDDKPVALGEIDPGTVVIAITIAVLLVIPLSIANGTYAGLAHLVAVASAWTYNTVFKKTVLSWLPFAVSFGLLPAFLSYGGLGGGMHGSPPTVAMTVFAAMLGIGIHFLNTLPDLAQDNETEVRHLPLRLALMMGAHRLLPVSVVWTVVAAAGIVVTAVTVGVAQ